jgi:O-antigen ligase
MVAGVAAGTGAFILGEPLLVGAAVLGVAGAALVVVSPDWALAALAAFAVLRIADIATDSFGLPSPFPALVGMVVLGIGYRWAATGRRPGGGGRAMLYVGSYLGIAMGSLLVASDPIGGFEAIELLIRDAGVAVLVGLLLRRTESLRALLWAIVGCGGVLAAVSVFQALTGATSEFLGFGKWSVEQIVGTYDDVRVSGPIGDANFYGQMLVMIVPIALDRLWTERRRALRLAAGASALLCAAAIVFTFSRGAAVALAVVVFMMLIVHPPRPSTVIAVGLAAVLAVPLLPQGYGERLSTLAQIGTVEGSTDASIRGRTAEVTAGWLMFAEHPLTGVGYANYGANYLDYVSGLGIELRREEREAHSLYLEVAAETGMPGILTFGAILLGSFACLARARRSYLEAGLREDADTMRALRASLVGFLIAALFLHLDFASLFWILVGACLAAPDLAERAARRRAEVPTWR